VKEIGIMNSVMPISEFLTVIQMVVMYYYFLYICVRARVRACAYIYIYISVFQKELYDFERVYRFIQRTYTMF
jgi:hypothetical protein